MPNETNGISGGHRNPLGRFSVVVTCHNQRSFIAAAVNSALRQNSNLLREVIVVDDGSTDGSQNLLEEYGHIISLCRHPKNLGALHARNEGAARATGEYLAFLDGDDILAPWALDVYEKVVVAYKPVLISAEVRHFSGEIPHLTDADKPFRIRLFRYSAFFAKDRPASLQASGYVVRRQMFWDVGGWTPTIFQLDLQDLSLKLGTFPVILVHSPFTALYRIHSDNSIHVIPPFIRNLHRILQKERAGMYPGGARERFGRYASLGGISLFWIKRSICSRSFTSALGILIAAYPMIVVALFRRFVACIRGRKAAEILDLRVSRPISD